jgi:hypothetical protein
MRIACLIFLLTVTLHVQGQLSLGIGYDQSFEEMSTGKMVKEYNTYGGFLKKPIGRQFNLMTGLNLKWTSTRLTHYIHDSDFEQYFRDNNPGRILPVDAYFNDANFYKFTFISLPIGVEFKVVPSIRLRYTHHVNWFVYGNKFVQNYIEFGKEAVKKISFNHDLAIVVFFPDSEYQLVLGAAMQPHLFRDNLAYQYDFTPAISNRLSDAVSFYMGINFETNILKRKRSVF